MRLSNSLKDIIEYLPYNPIFCKEEYGVLTKVNSLLEEDYIVVNIIVIEE